MTKATTFKHVTLACGISQTLPQPHYHFHIFSIPSRLPANTYHLAKSYHPFFSPFRPLMDVSFAYLPYRAGGRYNFPARVWPWPSFGSKSSSSDRAENQSLSWPLHVQQLPLWVIQSLHGRFMHKISISVSLYPVFSAAHFDLPKWRLTMPPWDSLPRTIHHGFLIEKNITSIMMAFEFSFVSILTFRRVESRTKVDEHAASNAGSEPFRD